MKRSAFPLVCGEYGRVRTCWRRSRRRRGEAVAPKPAPVVRHPRPYLHADAAVLAADQREGGALHSDGAGRVGVRTALPDVPGAGECLTDFLRYYNRARPHSALGYRTPAQRLTERP